MTYDYADAVVACADLAGRAGARDFQIGYVHDDVPVEEAGWYAHASYQGARVITDQHRSPTAAAMRLAERLLRGAQCRCGNPVALSDETTGCRWRLMGQRWEPGCDAPPVHMPAGTRGDVGAMHQAMNRAQRRATRKER